MKTFIITVVLALWAGVASAAQLPLPHHDISSIEKYINRNIPAVLPQHASKIRLAQIPWLLLGSGASSAPHVFPGDIAPGAAGWWGLRAYNLAYATGSNSAAIVCDAATFTTCSTINILSTGAIDVTTAFGSPACASTCVFKSFTDQTGGGNTMACASAAACATLTFNCIGSLPCATCAAACNYVGANFVTFTSPPVTASAVAERNGATTSFGGLFGGNTNNLFAFLWSSTPNTILIGYASTTATATAADNALHAFQIVLNGASSSANVDNTLTSPLTTGTGTLTNVQIKIGVSNGAAMTGFFTEVGYWLSAFTTGNQTAMCHNQFSYWGTAASC